MATFADQRGCRVRCEWGSQGIEALVASVDAVIIVDVLSFSTCVEIATNRSASILPYRWNDDSAAEYARSQNAELAGQRSQACNELSLSPSSLMQIAPGVRLVLPSPNGSSLAFQTQSFNKPVAAGCLRNAGAVSKWAASFQSIAVIPAGERWPDNTLRPAAEDLIGAGAIIRHIPSPWSPEAQVAVAAFETSRKNLPTTLLDCASGRELIERGFSSDVQLASQLNVSDCVPILAGNTFASCGRENDDLHV